MRPLFDHFYTGRILLLCVWLLAGCASKPPDFQRDTKFDSLDRSARHAFDLGQHEQAVTLYQAVLNEALKEDDLQAIVATRYNLAASQMSVGEYEEALGQINLAVAESERREAGWDPELTLLRATVLYRAGREQEAQKDLVQLHNGGAEVELNVRVSALFLSGLIAAKAGQADRLAAIIDAMDKPVTDLATANRLELEAWRLRLEGSADESLSRFTRLADLRRIKQDYRGMNRALSAAADLAEARGNTDTAAGYLLRAGRSAARLGQPEARAWLERALRLGTQSSDSALVREAELELAALRGD